MYIKGTLVIFIPADEAHFAVIITINRVDPRRVRFCLHVFSAKAPLPLSRQICTYRLSNTSSPSLSNADAYLQLICLTNALFPNGKRIRRQKNFYWVDST
jgi:hypothetical protein